MIDHDWRRQAACTKPDVDPDWFFPAETATVTKSNYKLARAVCAECPVIDRCQQDADIFINFTDLGLAGDARDAKDVRPVGVYAGLTEKERNGAKARKDAWYAANRDRVNAQRREKDRKVSV